MEYERKNSKERKAAMASKGGCELSLLNLALSDLFKELKTSNEGLREQDAREHLSQYGMNTLEQKRTLTDVEAFLRQFLNPLVMVLLFSGGLSFFWEN